MLCFAILFGSCVPVKSSWNRSDDYTTAAGVSLQQLMPSWQHCVTALLSLSNLVRSRVLLSVDSPQTFHNSNWFWYYLFGEEPAHLCRNDPQLPQYGCYSHAMLVLYTALTPDTSTDITNDTNTVLSPSA